VFSPDHAIQPTTVPRFSGPIRRRSSTRFQKSVIVAAAVTPLPFFPSQRVLSWQSSPRLLPTFTVLADFAFNSSRLVTKSKQKSKRKDRKTRKDRQENAEKKSQ
jgi:hypothetical protein